MDTKTCKECGRELPIIRFRRIRDGVICGVCKDCTNAKMRETKASKCLKMGVNYIDPEFEAQDATRGHRPHDTRQAVA